jgi:NADH oxidase
MYKEIFKEGYIGNNKIKNRIIMTSLTTNLNHEDGKITDRELKFLKARIDGGVGAIITGMIRIDDFYGNKFPYQPAATHTKNINSLRLITSLCHENDVKVFAQLNHPGAQTFRQLNHNLQQISASSYTPELINQKSREITIYEIENLIEQFTNAANICELAGFDGIEINAGQGYLLSSFLSPATNRRGDKYAYNELNKGTTILVEIIRKIRESVNKDFSIIIKYNFDDFIKGGIDINDSLEIAKILEKEKIDAIDLSCGTYKSMDRIVDNDYYPDRWKDKYIKKIKKNINIPVIANNNIKYHSDAEDMIEKNIVDFVGLGRALLADENWVKKAKEFKSVRPCVSCSHCFKSISNLKACECIVNPYMNRESYYKIEYNKNNNDKTIAVIGGGPAGCQSAITLAQKGYNVVLFEKEKHLGGTVRLASKAPFRSRLDDYIDYLEYELKELNVDIKLNTKADTEIIKNINPYAVFIATGTKAKKIDGKDIFTYEDVLSGKIKPKDKNIIVIGAGESGLETAEFLEEIGNKVRIIEATNMSGKELEYGARKLLLGRLKYKDIDIIPNTIMESFENGILKTKNDKEYNADIIVCAIGVYVDSEEIHELKKSCNNTILVGDAYKVRNIYAATRRAIEQVSNNF